MQPPQSQTSVRSYGCGKPGFVRCKCPDCSKTMNAPTAGAAFRSVSTISTSKPRPTVNLIIVGEEHAFLDTSARCSIASRNLHALLERKGVKFEETRMQIALADRPPRIRKVQVTELKTTLQGRTIKAKFIVLPGSKDNCTLLGVDFIDDAGIVLNISQQSWSYADTVEVQYDFAQEVILARYLLTRGRGRTPKMHVVLYVR
ncbi:hypothetical protein ANTQUA_LOCUS3666 [Anthophora quadrimaculata]